MSDIPTVTYYAYDSTRYVGQFSGEDSAVLAFIASKGYTTGPKPLANDRDLWVSILSGATAAQAAAEAAQAEIEAELAGLDFSAADRVKIDSIETGADVTDTANVTAAGALMDSEVTNLAAVKAFDPADYATASQGGAADSALQPATIGVTVQGYSAVLAATTASYTTAEETKLAGIEALADVTDTANVTAAGALMDSEVTNLAAVKAFDPADYATAAQGSTADTAVQPAAIANFETTTELNARDTANRSRANHTGTQAQSTVVGLVSDLAAKAPIAGNVTLTGGFDSDEEALGTITSGTVTPEVDGANKENFKTLTNNGAFTLAPPSTSLACCIRIHVINAASAGAITTTSFDKVNDPSSYATTNGKQYWFFINHNSTRSTLTIEEIV